MEIWVDFVYQLTIEVHQLFELLTKKCLHVLFFSLVLFLFSFFFGSASEIAVDWEIRVDFKDSVGLFSRNAAIFASANFFQVGTSPGITFLNAVNDVFLVDKNETVETEFLFAGSGLEIPVALVDHFVFYFAHMAGSYFNKGDRRAFVEGQLPDSFGVGLFVGGWLFFLNLHLTLSVALNGRLHGEIINYEAPIGKYLSIDKYLITGWW